MCHVCFNVFLQNAMFRCVMSARVDEELGDGVLSFFNGMKFKYNDLVDVIVGTGLGVRGNKTEPFKGQFKGVVETVRGVEFLVKPLVSGNGRCQQIPRHCVFKLQAFGTCVLGTRATRFFCKLPPAQKERCVSLLPFWFICSVSLSHLFCFSFTLVLSIFLGSCAGQIRSYTNRLQKSERKLTGQKSKLS